MPADSIVLVSLVSPSTIASSITRPHRIQYAADCDGEVCSKRLELLLPPEQYSRWEEEYIAKTLQHFVSVGQNAVQLTETRIGPDGKLQSVVNIVTLDGKEHTWAALG